MSLNVGLAPEQQQRRQEIEDLLRELSALLAEVPVEEHARRSSVLPDWQEDGAAVAAVLEQLSAAFLLVVVGEFNAGKSSLINVMLGENLLEEGPTPTTTRVQRLVFSPEPKREVVDGGILVVGAPAKILENLEVVDTPGTNAILRDHEVLTRRFLPRADYVLFVTSADRPFTESERSFLALLQDWGKKTIVVINKADILDGPEDAGAVREFVERSYRDTLGVPCTSFLVSTRRARSAPRSAADSGDSGSEMDSSGVGALVEYLQTALSAPERFRLKLSSALGVAHRVMTTRRLSVDEALAVLGEDLATLRRLDEQHKVYREDMSREFALRLGDVDRRLQLLELRGIEFFDELIRIARLPQLLARDKVAARFERDVVGELPTEIERVVGETVDWMVDREIRQWRSIVTTVQRRLGAHGERVTDALGEGVGEARRDLLANLLRTAKNAIASFDRQAESRRLAESVRRALAGAALLQVGAVGLGSIVAAAATSTAVDITGFLAAGTLAVIGLFVLPARRRRAKKELRETLARLRRRLHDGLSLEFAGESERSDSRLQEAAGPYTRFVRAEHRLLSQQRTRLEDLFGRGQRLRTLVGSPVSVD